MHLTLPHPHRSPERKRRPVQAHAIQHSRRQLLQLADDLETTGEPVNDRGVELVDQLLRAALH